MLLMLATHPAAQAATVDILETFDPGSAAGTYTVTNNSLVGINGFFIANDSATNVDAPLAFFNWGAQLVSREEWDLGYGVTYADSSTFSSSGISWDSLFSGFTQVISYWNDIELGSTVQRINSGETVAGFQYEAELPSSPFLAVFEDGSTFAGEATVVPVPAAMWLLASGLLGLIGIAGRKTTNCVA